MILKQGHKYRAMPHDGKVIRRIYRGGRCYYKDSPYSLAATQALKAAFPQYWTAIRDYGYAHPQLVPFINEDPMLIVSLVEVGKTRWLVGDGSAGIITNILDFDAVDADVLLTALPTSGVFGYNYNNNGTQRRKSFGFNGSGYPTFGIGDGVSAYIQKQDGWSLNYEYHIRAEFGTTCTLYQNGVKLYEGSATRSNPIECGIMCANTAVGTQNIKGRGKGFEVYLQGETIAKFLPFTRNGENGMLDILSGTFYPNANTLGAFTIELTDK